jgi:hypothetical protein
MTRKHYEAFARAIASMQNIDDRRFMALSCADIFKEDNPLFVPKMFFGACGFSLLETKYLLKECRESSDVGTET